VNEKGLHARASPSFVEVVEAHDARAEVAKDGLSVSGDSIMGLLMLAASRGTTIEVRTTGPKRGSLPMPWKRWLRHASVRSIEARWG
jgi:phosphocarrier protein HPr